MLAFRFQINFLSEFENRGRGGGVIAPDGYRLVWNILSSLVYDNFVDFLNIQSISFYFVTVD